MQHFILLVSGRTTIEFETRDGAARLITFTDYWSGDKFGDQWIGLPEKSHDEKRKEILALYDEIHHRAATVYPTLSPAGHLRLKIDDDWHMTFRAFDRFTDDYDWCGWLLLMPNVWIAAGRDQSGKSPNPRQ